MTIPHVPNSEAAAQGQCIPADTEQDADNIAVTSAWGPSTELQEH